MSLSILQPLNVKKIKKSTKSLKMTVKLNTKKGSKTSKLCDFPGCSEEGLYRAPKNRDLKEYHWFCLKHVREYNKNWDFYKGLNADEIEQHLVNDITWQRPTWKLGHGGIKSSPRLKDRLNILNDVGLGMDGRHNPPQGPQHLEEQIIQAITFMELTLPMTLSELKQRYKALAKKYHPDKNKNDPKAAKHFQTLSEAYQTLVAYLKNSSKRS